MLREPFVPFPGFATDDRGLVFIRRTLRFLFGRGGDHLKWSPKFNVFTVGLVLSLVWMMLNTLSSPTSFRSDRCPFKCEVFPPSFSWGNRHWAATQLAQITHLLNGGVGIGNTRALVTLLTLWFEPRLCVTLCRWFHSADVHLLCGSGLWEYSSLGKDKIAAFLELM